MRIQGSQFKIEEVIESRHSRAVPADRQESGSKRLSAKTRTENPLNMQQEEENGFPIKDLGNDSLRELLLAATKIQSLRSGIVFFMFFTFYFSFFGVRDAFAMHISEGILPFRWAAFWFALAAPFLAYGLSRLKKMSDVDLSFKPLVGLLAAVVFIVSCMPVPVPLVGTCSHPCGTGLSAILLGPGISVLVAFVALLIQALFLSHGGLSTLGANLVSMGVMGSFTGFLTFKFMRRFGFNLAVAGFAAGLFADWATYLATSVELASGIRGDSPFMPLFWKILIAFIPTQLPLGILEGAMTAGMVVLLYKKRPDLLIKMHVIKPEKAAV